MLSKLLVEKFNRYTDNPEKLISIINYNLDKAGLPQLKVIEVDSPSELAIEGKSLRTTVIRTTDKRYLKRFVGKTFTREVEAEIQKELEKRTTIPVTPTCNIHSGHLSVLEI